MHVFCGLGKCAGGLSVPVDPSKTLKEWWVYRQCQVCGVKWFPQGACPHTLNKYEKLLNTGEPIMEED
eukprot:g81993.t1